MKRIYAFIFIVLVVLTGCTQDNQKTTNNVVNDKPTESVKPIESVKPTESTNPTSEPKESVKPTAEPVAKQISVSMERIDDKNVKVILSDLPTTVDELKQLSIFARNEPQECVALALIALSNYKDNPQMTYDMLNLFSEEELSKYDRQFIRDRLENKTYKVDSYFLGSNPKNGYTYDLPITMIITETPYTYEEKDVAKLYMQSSGADSLRPIVVKKVKGEWKYVDQMLLSDIRPIEK